MPANIETGLLLRWTSPTSSGERELAPGQLIIGRSPSADLVLDDPLASRSHARLEVSDRTVAVHDLDSRNGTFVNNERVASAELTAGDRLRVGGSTLELIDPRSGTAEMGLTADATVVLNTFAARAEATLVMDAVAPEPAAAHPGEKGVVSDELLQRPLISEDELRANGVEVETADFAALGGGLGSFVWVDLLRNSGVPADRIAVVGTEDVPYARYQRLCLNSQIPPHERLRSNSDSCPDNVWGFPGYAVREAWGDLWRGRLGNALSVLWGIFGEPTVAQTYTPRSADVFDSIAREAARIGWGPMFRFGRIRAIRHSDRGRLVAIVSLSDERGRRHHAISARFLHLAIGYPAIQLLPDLAEYRERYERRRVVNAYEPHDHVYADLATGPHTVILRGRGIVASRILQRLWEERRRNPQISVVHLHRSRLSAGHRYGFAARQVDAEWEFQPFNWPKSCWGGQQRASLEQSSGEQRKALLEVWGGTTTAERSDWRAMVAEGLRAGWYRPEYGVVREVRPQDGKVLTRISNSLAGGGILELAADYVVDCTGLVASPDRSPLIADLMRTYSLPKNPLGRLEVSNDFEIEGMRHADARIYASGALTLGGPFAAVDSFLGLQYAAYRAVHAMQDAAPQLIRPLNGLYSLAQWFKWARGRAP